ncbi:SMI1/KNR4 family protein [Dokdonia ponticola]|uniref:SMI1/KNR4 family protein n=1 Tax=Dokdonia ponticola TaxID=2041041 RepID=A0ABV9HSQ8_9FLAO
MNITEKIQQIATWTSENFNEEVNKINYENGENDFAQIAEMLGETLPKVFSEIYTHCNGEVGNNLGILLGHEFLSTKKIISNLEFALGLRKPAKRIIIDPNASEKILNKISNLYLKSIPTKKRLGFFSKKWRKATFSCSHETYSQVSVAYENGETEKYTVKEKYSDSIFDLGSELHQLEKKDYNWDNLAFELFPDGKYTVERKDFIWEEEVNFSSCPKDAIKKKYFHHKWIPLFHDYGGNFIGIDLDPDSNGVKGQIIIYGRDEEKMIVVAESFDKFLDLTIQEINDNPSRFTSENHIHEVYMEIKNCA